MFKLQPYLLGALLSVELLAEPFKVGTVPNPRVVGGGFVSDPGQVIGAADRSALNESLQNFEKETSVEIAIVILPSIGTAVPKDFAVELFNRWGIGKKAKENGLLLLLVMDQRRWEFETGYGLEGALPDAFLNRTGENHLVPRLRQKQFARGFQETLVPIFARIRGAERADNNVSGDQTQSTANSGAFTKSGFQNTIYYFIFFYLTLGLIASLQRWIVLRRLLSASVDSSVKYNNIQNYLKEAGATLSFLLILPLFFEMWGRRICRRLRNEPRNCDRDGSLMTKIEEERDELFLPAGQKVEETIRSVDYDVWVCPTCEDVKFYSYELTQSVFAKCPECGFISRYLDKNEIMAKPTYNSHGKGRRHYACKHCKFTDITEYTIPKIRTVSRSGFGSSDSSSRSSGSGSSSRSSGSSRSRSGFGGGSSGGGGAGGSW